MESEEELQGLLENMMSQLMSKAVLYEPLKELSDKVCDELRLDSNKKLTRLYAVPFIPEG